MIELALNDNKTCELDSVICAKTLSENLLSLRKFAELGLSIYLYNEKIDIFDPSSNKSFITGVQNWPYWIIQFEINKGQFEGNRVIDNRKRIFGNLTTAETNDKNELRYKTRSVTANEKLKQNEKGETNKQNINESDNKTVTENQIQVGTNENVLNKSKSEKEIIYEHLNLDTTIWDRKFSDIVELPIVELSEKESPFNSKYNKFLKIIKLCFGT